MPHYVIGDVQGCYEDLRKLLRLIEFNSSRDRLWFTGDLVNRGPQSLDVLHLVMDLDDPIVVLGNHDMHLLGLAKTPTTVAKNHTLGHVLNAPDCEQLLDWLRHRPLLHHDINLGCVLIHAGLPPQWDLPLAKGLANEVETLLRGEEYIDLLSHMYGDEPDRWDEGLTSWNRLRFIINCFTRMRFCDATGRLNLTCKKPPGHQPEGFMPWFSLPDRKTKDQKIIFGHWAALDGKTDNPNVFAIDTGCAWGGRLTALRLEDGKRFCVACNLMSIPNA